MLIERIAVHRLGIIPFETARSLQEALADEIASGKRGPTLLLLEHPHTYTFGRRGQQSNLLWDAETLAQKEVAVVWTDRGGDVTYHGPGQLVGYPLLPLGTPLTGQHDTPHNGPPRLPQADYIGYLRRLEKVLITALARLGVVSGQLPGLTGVWVQPDVASRCRHCPPAARLAPSKIGALGVKVDARGISRHGFALNVNPDMAYWEGIVGCGLEGYPAISLASLVEPAPSMSTVISTVLAAFGNTFDCEMTEIKGQLEVQAAGMGPILQP
jgi:lipoate-protein ligase B